MKPRTPFIKTNTKLITLLSQSIIMQLPFISSIKGSYSSLLLWFLHGIHIICVVYEFN
ncbi:hypothetical protein CLM_0716 [Clostridium botulinum A2 str. Kyoto]|uniref:Uncharacterized protein n=1 Tax=Clostridium botulinum (strain Kyoto / Type A2) TaxID=536232 RepID=C1FT81_CLOBJ|nr:hypothetical protein CLM_0716 [Clostridium botulinum A2 str. Kyoto]